MKRCSSRAPRRPATQRGAALMVAMIMIFMLSLMGVSSMKSSTLEQQMAVNSILANDVLQAAESANEVVLNDSANLARAYESANNRLEVDKPLGTGTDVLFDSEVTLRYVGEGNAIGVSLNAGQNTSSFDALHYVSSGVARLDSVQAIRQVDQGVYRTAPAE